MPIRKISYYAIGQLILDPWKPYHCLIVIFFFFRSAAVDIRKPGWWGRCWRGRELKALHFTVKSTYTLYLTHIQPIIPCSIQSTSPLSTFLYDEQHELYLTCKFVPLKPRAAGKSLVFPRLTCLKHVWLCIFPQMRGNGWIVETISIFFSRPKILPNIFKRYIFSGLAGYNTL